MIRAALFDVDGTLVDSTNWMEQVANQTFQDIGIATVKPGYFTGLLKQGLGIGYYLKEVVKRPDLYGAAKEALIKNYAENIRYLEVFDGVDAMLKELKEEKIKTGICTSQHKQMLELTLKRFRFPVDSAISRDDVTNGKPAPDQILLLCKKLSVGAEEALAVGDWTGDIEAGKRAGAETAGVLTGLCSRKELEKAKPDHILKNATEVLGLV